jgi:hypothetical protein
MGRRRQRREPRLRLRQLLQRPRRPATRQNNSWLTWLGEEREPTKHAKLALNFKLNPLLLV